MKFIIDAQLPKTLVDFLNYKGYDALHTSDLLKGNATSDQEINILAEKENRTVITKDSDFVDSHLLYNKPAKLIVIKTGNISNNLLLKIFSNKIEDIVKILNEVDFIELTEEFIIAHSN